MSAPARRTGGARGGTEHAPGLEESRGGRLRRRDDNVRPLLLRSALEAARRRGYGSVRVSDITDPVGVTRQTFYAHFRDKRHCIAEALDPRLGVVERMAAALSERDPSSSARLTEALDDVISERFGSLSDTRARILDAMIELLRESGSLHKVKISALVRRARVAPRDYYRQFSDKWECFAVAYERLLDDLVAEVREECFADYEGADLPIVLRSLAKALNSDPERRRILIFELARLPNSAPDSVAGARKRALADSVASLIADSREAAFDGRSLELTACAIVEVIRSAELNGEADRLPEDLVSVAATWRPSAVSAPQLLVA